MFMIYLIIVIPYNFEIYMAMRFDVLLYVLLNSFSVSTPTGDSIMANRVYTKYLVSMSHRVNILKLVNIYMLDFDVTLGMGLMHSCYSSIDCRNHVLKFEFLDKSVLQWKGEVLSLRVSLSFLLMIEIWFLSVDLPI